jgi:cytochrome oxidase assembly protein ShyY1
MDPKYYGLVEIVFSSTIVFGLGFWQLWSLRREKTRDRARQRAADTAASSSDEAT